VGVALVARPSYACWARDGVSVSTVLLALLVWLGALVFICALLTAAKRGAGPDDPPQPVAIAALDRLVWQVRSELAVEQVLIVACDEHGRDGAVVVAGAGVSASLLGVRFTGEESVAARVAGSGRDVLAAGHGRLDRPRGRTPAMGDAAAVALSFPDGAIAIARLDPARPLTPADLLRLRAVVRRERARFPHMSRALRAARAEVTPRVAPPSPSSGRDATTPS
jgi:hypothetical protein